MTHTHSATPSHGRLYGLMSALACFLLLAAVQVSAKDISVKDAATLLQNPPQGLTIVDVRTPAEFREGHLAGAINMDFFGASFDSRTSPCCSTAARATALPEPTMPWKKRG